MWYILLIGYNYIFIVLTSLAAVLNAASLNSGASLISSTPTFTNRYA